MRNVLAITCIGCMVLMVGCGGRQQYTQSVEAPTQVLVRGSSLVGTVIRVDENFMLNVTAADLTPYRTGVAGAADTEIEKLDTVTLTVTPGERRIRVSSGGNDLIDATIYANKGQRREIRIK